MQLQSHMYHLCTVPIMQCTCHVLSRHGAHEDTSMVQPNCRSLKLHPPVDGAGVAALGDELWRQVLGGAAQRVRLGARLHALRKAKVRQLQIAVDVQQQVLRF